MDIARFDLNLLRMLDVLLEERGVSSAASRVGLSQPAMSAALSRLRVALGDPLLVRRGNQLEPTSFAENLRPRLRGLLVELQRVLAAQTFDPRTDERRFRVAATDYAAMVVLLPLMAELRTTAPGVAFDVLALDDRVETDLATGLCDLVLGGAGWLGRVDSKELLFREDYVSLARRDHPRLSAQVTLDQFLAERHVLISLHRQTVGVVDEALAALGRSRTIGLTLPSFLLAPHAVAASDLILTTGHHIAKMAASHLDLRIFPTPLAVEPYFVPMGAHRRSEHDPAIGWLKQEIRKFTAGLAFDASVP